MAVTESRAGASTPTECPGSRERVLLGVILLAGLVLRLFGKLDPMYEGYFISPTIGVYRRQIAVAL